MEKFKVFSMLADITVYEGTKSQCDSYVFEHSSGDNTLYTVKA